MTDHLDIPPSLDAQAAEDLLRVLRERVLSGLPVVFDASKVERIATPCAQILAAAAREAGRNGVPFTLHAPSAAMNEALTMLGLQAEFAIEGTA